MKMRERRRKKQRKATRTNHLVNDGRSQRKNKKKERRTKEERRRRRQMEMSEGKPCGKAAVESAADARGLFIHIVLSAIVKILINHFL